jgi:hypothetical protein
VRKINYNLTEERLRNILTDTVETGAVDYWVYDIGEIIRDKDSEFGDIIQFTIDAEDWDETGEIKEYIINRSVIEKGIKNLFSEDFSVNPDILKQFIDDDIDSDGCDCIIQAGIFNELLYG